MGYKLNISDVFDTILHGNPVIAAKITPAFIRQWIKLLVNVGKKRKYLRPLIEIMNSKIDSGILTVSQTVIVQGLKKFEDKVTLFLKDLKIRS